MLYYAAIVPHAEVGVGSFLRDVLENFSNQWNSNIHVVNQIWNRIFNCRNKVVKGANEPLENIDSFIDEIEEDHWDFGNFWICIGALFSIACIKWNKLVISDWWRILVLWEVAENVALRSKWFINWSRIGILNTVWLIYRWLPLVALFLWVLPVMLKTVLVLLIVIGIFIDECKLFVHIFESTLSSILIFPDIIFSFF